MVAKNFVDLSFWDLLNCSLAILIRSSCSCDDLVLIDKLARRSTRLPMFFDQVSLISFFSPTWLAASITVCFNMCCVMPLSPSSTMRATSFVSDSSRAARTRVAVETMSWSWRAKCSKDRRRAGDIFPTRTSTISSSSPDASSHFSSAEIGSPWASNKSIAATSVCVLFQLAAMLAFRTRKCHSSKNCCICKLIVMSSICSSSSNVMAATAPLARAWNTR
mmetsp:Transcript_72991/g.211301  ORF Transcript_72991/g.211301 Transcript_72991/m.211301 type:complete len:220 (+) Transcript_72991:210-869(+)